MNLNLDTLVSDVKGKIDPIVATGQEVVTVSFDTLKQANGIVVEGVQSLVKTNVTAGRDLLAAAQTSFEKAKADGIKAVAAAPIEYVPAGRAVVVTAYNDSVVVVTETGEKLVKVVKSGYESVSARISGEPVVVTKTRTAVKKTAKKVTAATRKATA